MSKDRYNRSKTYLLPLISEVIGIESNFIDFLEDTYLFKEDDKEEYCFYIEHEFVVNNPEFIGYEHRIISNNYYLKSIDVGNRVIYVFRFPEEYLPEYNYFLDGKYSKFGEDAKQIILKFWTKMYGRTATGVAAIVRIKQVLYKDKKLKQELEDRLSSEQSRVVLSDDAELIDIIETDEETVKV